ncbi:MAG: hypothetical protein [Bacteriophage sp.]|nr:MAG: hypothetical protein [Bacteriophage sp.]
MAHTTGSILLEKTDAGFMVYGRFGAVLRADAVGNVTYSNMNPEAQEYMRMAAKVRAALAGVTTVQQVPAQSVYTLELAVGTEVASKEYMDYTRAKAAYDLVVHDTQHGWHEVTRIELFSEAVGSMDKWERSCSHHRKHHEHGGTQLRCSDCGAACGPAVRVR